MVATIYFSLSLISNTFVLSLVEETKYIADLFLKIPLFVLTHFLRISKKILSRKYVCLYDGPSTEKK